MDDDLYSLKTTQWYNPYFLQCFVTLFKPNIICLDTGCTVGYFRLLKPCAGYPRHRKNRENRENGNKKNLSEKTQGIWKFCQNTGKFVCSSCKFIDSKGIGWSLRYLPRKFPLFSRSWIGLPSHFCVCNSYKLCKLAQGKFSVGQVKKTGKTQGIWKYNLSGYPACGSRLSYIVGGTQWLQCGRSGPGGMQGQWRPRVCRCEWLGYITRLQCAYSWHKYWSINPSLPASPVWADHCHYDPEW